MFNTILEAWSGPGAGFMYAITALLALALAVMAERSWRYWIQWRLDEAALLAAASDGTLTPAQAGPFAGLVTAAQGAQTAERAWDAMGGEAPLIESSIRQRISYLSSVGNLSTMMGLLGTVYGLIMAFSGLADATAVTRSAQLSEGIATAMATTAWGLMVGMPALAAHTILDARASRLIALADALASRLAARCAPTRGS